MGMGSLKRIAALCLLATLAVFALGGMNVLAVTVPSTTVTVPTTTTTVTTPTVRVPSTAVTTPAPAPQVTAPAPKPAPAPVVKQVTKPVTQVTKPVTQVTKPATGTAGKTVSNTTGTINQTAPKATSGIKQTTTKATQTVTDTGSSLSGGGTGGGGTGSGPSGPEGPVDRILGTVTGGLSGTTTNATGAGSGMTLVRGADGMTYLAVPGGGFGGPGGTAAGGGFGGGGGAGAGGASLATLLAGASPKRLRAVLDHLEGCLPALPAIDRQVISMRAGVNGPPLTRPQIGARLGLTRQGVRSTERRALNRLQYAAANTSCAGALVGPFDVAGIGNLTPQLIFAGAVPVNGSSGSLAQDFTAVRGTVPRSSEPLFALQGGGAGGPAWAIILFTVLFSVSIAALTRELRSSI